MTYVPAPRPHLVERAVEALGQAHALGRTPQAAPVPDPAAAPPPAPPPPAAPAPIGLQALQQAGLLVGQAGTVRSRLSEEISLIQQQLLRSLRAAEPAEGRCTRAILVTSARPGEGKSFTSLNLAASIAASSAMPVLLVDADGKRGSLSELLGTAQAPGLRLLAARQAPHPAALVLATAQPRLSFLPYGAPVAGASPVPPGAQVAAAILRLAAMLPDHVLILDSPPCLATSDPSSLAAVVGQVLMVVQAEKTQRDEVEAALDMVDACPVLQLLLNRTQLTSNDSFGAYGAYDVYGAHGPQASG